jgi:pyrroline-5-carboxylate reductase
VDEKMSLNNTIVTVIGAGGKMGCRVTDNLIKTDCKLFLCENGEAGINRIRDKGLNISDISEVVPKSHIVIMAVPDSLLGRISESLVPLMNKNATMIILDPAAAYAKELSLRDDCTFIVVHPCHPALFTEQDTPEARRDFFGGIARQDIVIAKIQGRDEKLMEAEMVCKEMFAPVAKCHWVTVEQMAFLEPALSEVIAATCAYIMKQAVEEAVKQGIPEDAAESFLLGHINVLLAIFFKKIPAPVSDACKIAVKCGIDMVFKNDWRKVFEPEVIDEVVKRMLNPDKNND